MGFYEDEVPYFLDIQSDFLSPARTRVVIPLRIVTGTKEQLPQLNPIFRICQKELAMITQEITHLPLKDLGAFTVSLAGERDRILGAIDVLITGI